MQYHKIKKIVITLGFIGTAFLVALVLVLLTLVIYLQGEVEYRDAVLETRQGESKSSQIETVEDKFSAYNKKTSKIDTFYQEQDHPSEFLKEFDAVLPSSVYLTSLSYKKVDEEDNKARVSASGYCPTREKLLALKNKIDQKEKWQKLDLPPANWTEATDIDFSLSFKIKSETEE